MIVPWEENINGGELVWVPINVKKIVDVKLVTIKLIRSNNPYSKDKT